MYFLEAGDLKFKSVKVKSASTNCEPMELFSFFWTDSLKIRPQVCDLLNQFGTDSAKIHDFLDLDEEVVQEFPALKT